MLASRVQCTPRARHGATRIAGCRSLLTRVSTTVVVVDESENDTIAPVVSVGFVTPRHTVALHVGSPTPNESLASCVTAPELIFTLWLLLFGVRSTGPEFDSVSAPA